MAEDSNVRQKYKQPDDVYERFVEEYGIFEKKMDLFFFTGCLGYYFDEIDVDDYQGDGEMLWMHFSNQRKYRATAAAIAYQRTEDPGALVDPSTQLQILAQYAAGGIDVLRREFGEVKGDPTDALMNFIQDHRDPDREEEQETLLGEIVSSFDEEMVGADLD